MFNEINLEEKTNLFLFVVRGAFKQYCHLIFCVCVCMCACLNVIPFFCYSLQFESHPIQYSIFSRHFMHVFAKSVKIHIQHSEQKKFIYLYKKLLILFLDFSVFFFSCAWSQWMKWTAFSHSHIEIGKKSICYTTSPWMKYTKKRCNWNIFLIIIAVIICVVRSLFSLPKLIFEWKTKKRKEVFPLFLCELDGVAF